MSKVLLSLGIWIASFFITVLVSFIEVLLVFLLPFDKYRKFVHAQCFWWADWLIALNQYWNLDVKGLENIDHKKTYVIVANHQSLADIIVLYKTRMQFKWVAKRSLYKIPFIGAMLWAASHIMLARGEFGSIKKVYREAAVWLRKGVSVAFFPEGTRSDTDEMNPFQNGAFKLAIKEKIPILPVAIRGTRDAIPKGSWVFKMKVSGSLTVFPAIDTAKYAMNDFAKLRDIVRDTLTLAG